MTLVQYTLALSLLCCFLHRVTVVKDKEMRRSKGVAFVLYLDRDSAHKCVHSLNNTEVS
jgi:RNA recognition motif-containing protein